MMNKEELQLVKEFVTKALSDQNGISLEAYSSISSLMQLSREFAMEMHDVLANVAINGNRCMILGNNDEVWSELDGYEH